MSQDVTIGPNAGDQGLYQRLAAPFSDTFTRTVGGTPLTYITGEQCISRLNECFGFLWTFEVVDKGYNEEADEIWVQGRLTIYQAVGQPEPLAISRSQFGSQQIKRRRDNQKPLDIGFEYKGACTDALKKCASLFGVGLYLSRKEETISAPSDDGKAFAQAHQQRAAEDKKDQPKPAPARPATPNTNAEKVTGLTCADCGEPLQEIRFKDGTVWSPAQLAAYGKRKFGRNLDMPCYRKAGEAAKVAVSEAVGF